MIAARCIQGFDLCSPGASATGPASQQNCCSVCVTSTGKCRSSSKPLCQINAFPVTPFDILFEIYRASVFSKEFPQPFRAHFQKRLTRAILANFVLQKAAKRFSHRFSFCRCTHKFRNVPHAFSVLFFASCREIFRIPRLQICRK